MKDWFFKLPPLSRDAKEAGGWHREFHVTTCSRCRENAPILDTHRSNWKRRKMSHQSFTRSHDLHMRPSNVTRIQCCIPNCDCKFHVSSRSSSIVSRRKCLHFSWMFLQPTNTSNHLHSGLRASIRLVPPFVLYHFGVGGVCVYIKMRIFLSWFIGTSRGIVFRDMFVLDTIQVYLAFTNLHTPGVGLFILKPKWCAWVDMK